MAKKKVFGQVPEKKQKEYERLARLEYGPTLVNESVQRWNSYTKDQQNAVLEEGNRIYWDITAALEAGIPAQHEDVQIHIRRWHEHIRNFYEPRLEILRGLGDLYTNDERFRANHERLHKDLPEFLREGIHFYVDELETAEIQGMLNDDQQQNS